MLAMVPVVCGVAGYAMVPVVCGVAGWAMVSR
jgi:hypothetical protein